MKDTKITVTPLEILGAEYWESPLHLLAKKGLPVKYKNFFDVKTVEVDWDVVESVTCWDDPINSNIIYVWRAKHD